MKKKINKAEFDKLSPELQALYKAVEGTTDYSLQLEDDNSDELTSKLADLEVKFKEANEKLIAIEAEKAKAKEARDKANFEKAKAEGDVEKILASAQEKYNKLEADKDAIIEKLKGTLNRELVNNVAQNMANEISTAPSVILPHILSRLSVDFDGDNIKTRVLDKDGNASALSLKDLSKEFVENKDFSAIIKGSTPTGGQSRTVTQPQGVGGNGGEFNIEQASGAQLVATFGKQPPPSGINM